MRFAFVLLREPRLPALHDVLRSYADIAPDGPGLRADASVAASSAVMLGLRLTTQDAVHVALMPAPVPDGEADAAARYSISSFGTGWTLADHKAHLLVVLQEAEHRPPVETLRAFTRVVAALAQAGEALGVYWSAGHATHALAFFLDVARHDREQIMLWTGVRVAAGGPDRVSLLTLGMSQLGQQDVMLTAPRSAGNQALCFLFDLLAYFVRRGAPARDGETVGRTAQERLPVRWVPSPLDPTQQVVCVDLPEDPPASMLD
jgi:hypothetical protein